MSQTARTSLPALLGYMEFLNRELHLDLGGTHFFTLLSGQEDPLGRLAAPKARPNEANLPALYHLNLLQYAESEMSATVAAELEQLRARVLGSAPNDGASGARAPLDRAALQRLHGTLNDLWLIDSSGVLRAMLLTQVVTAVDYVDAAGLTKLLGETAPLVLVAGNLARASFLYGIQGYFRMLLEAGRLIEVLVSQCAMHVIEGADLEALNQALRFNSERYSCLAALVAS